MLFPAIDPDASQKPKARDESDADDSLEEEPLDDAAKFLNRSNGGRGNLPGQMAAPGGRV